MLDQDNTQRIVRFNGSGNNDIAIISGTHGDELTPLRCLMLLEKTMKEIDPILYRSVTIVIGINTPALRSGTRSYSPKPTSDLNRSFKFIDYDDPKELMERLIHDNDVVIDVHSSPDISEFYLVDINKFTPNVISILEMNESKYACRYFNGDTIKKYILNQDKIGLTLELNGMTTIDESSAFFGKLMLKKFIENSNKLDNRIDEDMSFPIKEMIEIKSDVEGIFEKEVIADGCVEVGDVIGYIRDLNWDVIKEVTAPCNGAILGYAGTQYTNVSDTVVMIQPC